MGRKNKLAVVLGLMFMLQVPVAQAGAAWGTCRQVYFERVIEQVLNATRRAFTKDVVKPHKREPVRAVHHRAPSNPPRR